MTCNSEVATANTSNNTKLIISAQQAGKNDNQKIEQNVYKQKIIGVSHCYILYFGYVKGLDPQYCLFVSFCIIFLMNYPPIF